jgi:hypothetical protein
MSDSFTQSAAKDFMQSPGRERIGAGGVTVLREFISDKEKNGYPMFSSVYKDGGLRGSFTRPEWLRRFLTLRIEFSYSEKDGGAVTGSGSGVYSITFDRRNAKVLSLTSEIIPNYPPGVVIHTAMRASDRNGGALVGTETVSGVGNVLTVSWSLSDLEIDIQWTFDYSGDGSSLHSYSFKATLSDEYADADWFVDFRDALQFPVTSGRNGIAGVPNDTRAAVEWNQQVLEGSFLAGGHYSFNLDTQPHLFYILPEYIINQVYAQIDITLSTSLFEYFGPSQIGYNAAWLGVDSNLSASPRLICRASRYIFNRPLPERFDPVTNRNWCVLKTYYDNTTLATVNPASYPSVVTAEADGSRGVSFDLGIPLILEDKRDNLYSYPNMTPAGTAPNCTCL